MYISVLSLEPKIYIYIKKMKSHCNESLLLAVHYLHESADI